MCKMYFTLISFAVMNIGLFQLHNDVMSLLKRKPNGFNLKNVPYEIQNIGYIFSSKLINRDKIRILNIICTFQSLPLKNRTEVTGVK